MVLPNIKGTHCDEVKAVRPPFPPTPLLGSELFHARCSSAWLAAALTKAFDCKLQRRVTTSAVTRSSHLKCGVCLDCLARAPAPVVLSFLSVGKVHADAEASGICHTADETLAKCRNFSQGLSAEPFWCFLFERLSCPAGLEGSQGACLSEQHLDEVPPEKGPTHCGLSLSLSHPLLRSPFQLNHFLPTICCLNSTVRMTYLNTPLSSGVISP